MECCCESCRVLRVAFHFLYHLWPLVFIGRRSLFSRIGGLSVAGFYRSTVAIARVLLALALVLSVASATTPLLMALCTTLPLRAIHVDVDGLSIALNALVVLLP